MIYLWAMTNMLSVSSYIAATSTPYYIYTEMSVKENDLRNSPEAVPKYMHDAERATKRRFQ